MTILLRPQREQSEVYPFRRVWRTASIEAGLLLILTLISALLLPRLPLPVSLQRLVGIAFTFVPVVLWFLFSIRGERKALQPRTRLIPVAILGALVSSGIGIPLVERFYAVDTWLTTVDGLSRIIGFTLTAGMTHAFLQYVTLRFSFWPEAFEYRLDGIAYGMAVALGYATAINLNFALSATNLAPASIVLRTTEQTLAQVAISTIIGYCLVELNRPNVFVFMMPAGLLISALLHGLAIVIRAGLIVTGVTSTTTGNSATMGLAMAVVLLAVLFLAMRFLILNADERENLRRGVE